MDIKKLKKELQSYLRELNQLEETDFLKGQKLLINKIIKMNGLSEIKEFFKDNLNKVEKSVFDDNTDNEVMRGYLSGMYKVGTLMQTGKGVS